MFFFFFLPSSNGSLLALVPVMWFINNFMCRFDCTMALRKRLTPPVDWF